MTSDFSVDRIFLPEIIYLNDKLLRGQYFSVDDRGIISRTGSVSSLETKELTGAAKLSGICLPGLVNSHSHAFQVLLRGWGDNPKNFHDWVATKLYPLAGSITKEEMEIASKVAYAQMIRNGITTVAEFHYIHNPLPNETTEGEDPYAESMIQAALSTGIRQRFLYTGYDQQRREEQKRFIRNPQQVIQSLNALHSKYKDHDQIHIGAAPHSLHGASKEMITLMVEWARTHDEILHIHLSEQESDIEFAEDLYQQRPVTFLASHHLLDDHMVFVHSIWLDETEIELMAMSGVSHVYNPLTNMALGDGIAPVPQYIAKGILTSVGTDANISLDILKEVRAVEWLQRVQSLEMGIVQQELNGKSAGPYLFDMATKNAQTTLKLPIGQLNEGYYGDFIVINPQDLSLRPDQFLIDQLVSSVSIRDVLSSVYVKGKLVYDAENGFTMFDESALIKQFQSLPYGNN